MFHPNTDILCRLLKSGCVCVCGWGGGGGGLWGGMNLHVLSDYVALLSILFKTIIISTP